MTDRDCPRCGSTLQLDRGTLIDVHRCQECRFEGVRSPLAKAIDRITG